MFSSSCSSAELVFPYLSKTSGLKMLYKLIPFECILLKIVTGVWMGGVVGKIKNLLNATESTEK